MAWLWCCWNLWNPNPWPRPLLNHRPQTHQLPAISQAAEISSERKCLKCEMLHVKHFEINKQNLFAHQKCQSYVIGAADCRSNIAQIGTAKEQASGYRAAFLLAVGGIFVLYDLCNCKVPHREANTMVKGYGKCY